VNKYLAKVASDLNKPDGLTVVPVSEPEILEFLAPLRVGRIWGIGKVSAAQLEKAGIRTIGELQQRTVGDLARCLGSESLARHAWELARGRDDRLVVTDWVEKSISNETTFDEDCADQEVVRQTLLELTERVGSRLRNEGMRARTAQIKIRRSDFSTITRQCSFAAAVDSDRDLLDAAFRLFDREQVRHPVRLIGFGVSNLLAGTAEAMPAQPLLFPELDPARTDPRNQRIDTAVDALRRTFGRQAIKRGNWKAD
jgi:DNA polymerase-4